MLLWGVSCSESEPAAEMPGAMPDTVIIGCAGVGAEIESRTELGADGLSVQWVSGDEIRLWARPAEGDGAFTVANVPFQFDYFSPSRTRAGFTGTIPDVENLFTANSYDYCAITPVPADENLDGTLATYTIPAVQTGRFDPAIDIMTARQKDAAPLKAGDNNPYIRLEFEHHIHVLKFTIPSSKLLGDIVAVELEFEKPVVGTLQVDAAGEQPDNTEGIDQNTLRLEFPKGEEKNVGDTFYAMIAPTSFEEGQTIVMRVMAGRSETSVHYAFNKPREFAAGHTTPIELNVPKADTRYTVVSFKVSDVRPDGSQENCYGENTLGERVQQFMLTGAEGAFSNAVSMMPTGYCEVPEDANGTKLICTIPSEEEAAAIGFDGTYTLTFVSYKTETSTCPYEKWDKTPISGQLLPVEYFSERAWIRSVDNWDPIQTDDAVPEIEDGGEYSVTLTIPYLFEENFSNASEAVYNPGLISGAVGGYSSRSLTGFHSSGWSGCWVLGSNGYMEILHKVDYALWSYGRYFGRLDSANILTYLNSETSNANVCVSFDYDGFRWSGNASASYSYSFAYGKTNRTEVIDPYYERALYSNGSTENNLVENLIIMSTDEPQGTIANWEFECSTPTRLSWQMNITGNAATSGEAYIQIKNVRVSLK